MIDRKDVVFPSWAMPGDVVELVDKMSDAARCTCEAWLEQAIRHQAAIDRKLTKGREAIRRFNGEEAIEVEVEGT